MRGHFAAHARYLLRDQAMRGGTAYGPQGDVALVETVKSWQTAGDARLFKIVLSPEFGSRLDLTRLTREFMERVSRDLGGGLQWAAVNHYNTDHHHVHLVVRGRSANGADLRIPGTYIQHNLRAHASALCTEQLGFRSEADRRHAAQHEVRQHRFTSLDRQLVRIALPDDDGRLLVQPTSNGPASSFEEPELLAARLRFLVDSGLARRAKRGVWSIPNDLESTLRLMQRASDRQRMLANAGAAISDDRLPQRFTELKEITQLRGRVLGHTENDSTGRRYMILEAGDATIRFIPHDARLERERAAGRLRVDHFVTLERDARGLLITDAGDARRFVGALVSPLPPWEAEAAAAAGRWGGWLGSFHARLQGSPLSSDRPPYPARSR